MWRLEPRAVHGHKSGAARNDDMTQAVAARIV